MWFVSGSSGAIGTRQGLGGLTELTQMHGDAVQVLVHRLDAGTDRGGGAANHVFVRCDGLHRVLRAAHEGAETLDEEADSEYQTCHAEQGQGSEKVRHGASPSTRAT